MAGRSQFLVLVGCVAAFNASAHAIVLYSGDGTLASHPADSILGKWASNASAVAIASDYVLTVRHQGGGVGTTVTINGIGYTVSSETDINTAPGTPADLRVCKLTIDATHPALTQFATIYSNTGAVPSAVVLGGFGQQAGTALANGIDWNGVYGTESWGTNTLTAVGGPVSVTGLPYSSYIIQDQFDAEGTDTAHEAAIADGDSGGGWFVNVSGQWELAGLGAYTTTDGESIFNPPDSNDAIFLAPYLSQINAAVPEPTSLAMGGMIGLFALARRKRRA